MGFAAGFQVGWDAVDKAVESARKRKVRDMVESGMRDAKAEADKSGGTMHTLDKGTDSKDADYQSKNKADIDMIARQEDDIKSLQGMSDAKPVTQDPAGTQAPGLQSTGAETYAMGEKPAVAPQTELVAANADARGMAAAVAGLRDSNGQTSVMTDPTNLDAKSTSVAGLSAAVDTAKPDPEAAKAEPGYTRGEYETPKYDASEIFHKKYAPGVISELMAQGKLTEATAFENWSESQQGKAYGKSWMNAVNKINDGDVHGAMVDLQKLYNDQLPDGQYAVIVPGKKDADGNGTYSVQVRDEKSNKLLGERSGSTRDVLGLGARMLEPKNIYSQHIALAQRAADRAEKVADKKEQYAHEERLKDKEIEAKAGLGTTIAKAQADRRAAAAKFGEDSKEVKQLDNYINKLETRGEGGVTLNFGTAQVTGVGPDGTTQVWQTGKDGSTRTMNTGLVDAKVLEEDIATQSAREELAGVTRGSGGFWMKNGTLIPDQERIEKLRETAKRPFRTKSFQERDIHNRK